MKYREVIFVDTRTGKKFFTRSTAETTETILGEDGKLYPMVKVEVSSDSHPAFTGQIPKSVGVTARVEAFRKRYARS